MTTVLLSAPEASLVRDALGRECETCRGRGLVEHPTIRLVHDVGCDDCNGSGIHPSPVHLVVEGGRKYCSFHFPTVYERYTQEYGIADPGTESCVCSWLPPSRWPDGERVVLTVEFTADECDTCAEDRTKDYHDSHDHAQYHGGKEGVVPLASATVRVLPALELNDPRDVPCLAVEPGGRTSLWAKGDADGFVDITLPSVPRPGIDWLVTLSDLRLA